MPTESIPLEVMPSEQQNQLLAVVQENGLAADTAQSLQTSFAHMFASARAVMEKSRAINVTDASQKLEIKLARECRLALKTIRVDGDKVRKTIKEESLRRSKAIDGFYNIFLHLTETEEKRLEDQEKFVERQEAARKAALKEKREEILRGIQIDPALYHLEEMAEETFVQLVEGTKLARAAQAEAARKAEAEKIEREAKEQAERERIRAENERLKKEAEEREAAAKVQAELARKEKEAAEAERLKAKQEADAAIAKAKADAEEAARKERAELEARAKAEREAAAAKMAEERRKSEEAASTERERVAVEKKIADEKARVEREALERKAAEEKAAREKVEKAAREAREKEDKRIAEESAARKKAEAAPDKEKIAAFAAILATLPTPKLTSENGLLLQAKIAEQIAKFSAWVAKEGEKL